MGTAKCGACEYNRHCTKGCYGAHLESNGDPFYPCTTVCDLYKARVIFLYHKYNKMNLFGNINDKEEKNFLETIEKVKETEEFKKWSEISL